MQVVGGGVVVRPCFVRQEWGRGGFDIVEIEEAVEGRRTRRVLLLLVGRHGKDCLLGGRKGAAVDGAEALDRGGVVCERVLRVDRIVLGCCVLAGQLQHHLGAAGMVLEEGGHLLGGKIGSTVRLIGRRKVLKDIAYIVDVVV